MKVYGKDLGAVKRYAKRPLACLTFSPPFFDAFQGACRSTLTFGARLALVHSRCTASLPIQQISLSSPAPP